MFIFAKQLGAAALTGVVALTLVAPSAHAAPPPPPKGLLTPFSGPGSAAASWPFGVPPGVTLPMAALNVTTAADALSHLPGLRPGDFFTANSNNSDLSLRTQNINANYTNFDYAKVIEASSRAEVTHGEARLKGLEARFAVNQIRRQERIDWEERRDMTFRTRKDERDRQRSEELDQSLNLSPNAAPSARVLNTLLEDLQKLPLDLRGPDVALAKEVIPGINFSPGNRSGNPGLLKKELSWPPALQGPEFQAQRELIASMIPAAMQQAANGKVDGAVLENMKDAASDMQSGLSRNLKCESISPNQHIEAKRFLDQMDDALKVLQQPDAGKYFSGAYSAEGKTVAELVRSMTAKGLKFAPPVDDEAAYLALYRALVSYHAGAHYQMDKTNLAMQRSP
jgi:hypothetical protein